MAYFDLATDPAAIKSKSSEEKTRINLSNFCPKNKKPIGNDWDVNPGDIISWSDYRATDTYFVTAQRHLCKNRDISEAGYLTIPLSITRLFPSALEHYKAVIEAESDMINSIELAPTDGIFAEKFGLPLPEIFHNRTDVSFSYDPMDEILFITVNDIESDGFPVNETKTEDIVEYINSAYDKRVAFIVTYDIKGKEVVDKWPQDSSKDLPVGWSRTQHGGASFGGDFATGAWRFEGFEKTKETAFQIAEKFYEGFGVDIKWETDSS